MGGRRGGRAGERHSELTLAAVAAGFHHCSVACRGTGAAPGPYELFQLCNSQQHQPGLVQQVRLTSYVLRSLTNVQLFLPLAYFTLLLGLQGTFMLQNRKMQYDTSVYLMFDSSKRRNHGSIQQVITWRDTMKSLSDSTQTN